MDRALYLAMTGAKHNMLAQNVHANNLANVSTGAFKADFAQARSMGVYHGEGYPTRAYALTENPASDLSQGAVNRTGRDLDIALEGQGFLAVQTPDGGEGYTRNGKLYTDSVGILRTGNHLPVMGDNGPIALPEYDKLEVGVDGTISVVLKGEQPDLMVEVNRIKLVNPEQQAIHKGEDGLFHMANDELAEPDINVRVVKGFLESSNVNAVNELTQILSLSRQYEMSVKLMKTVDENSQASARLLQMQ